MKMLYQLLKKYKNNIYLSIILLILNCTVQAQVEGPYQQSCFAYCEIKGSMLYANCINNDKKTCTNSALAVWTVYGNVINSNGLLKMSGTITHLGQTGTATAPYTSQCGVCPAACNGNCTWRNPYIHFIWAQCKAKGLPSEGEGGVGENQRSLLKKKERPTEEEWEQTQEPIEQPKEELYKKRKKLPREN